MFRSYLSLICISLFLLVLHSCANSPGRQATAKDIQASDVYAFVGVQVLPMTSEEILQDQTVVVQEGRILAIGESGKTEIPEGAHLIKGKNRYLMPGLAEMHAHIPVPGEESDSLVYETLFLWMANGITTVRGMLGHPFHLNLKEAIEKEVVFGPRVFTSGPSINGNSAPDPEVGEKMVREQKEAGYDFLKLHPGLSLQTFDRIVAVAKEVDIAYAGHVSVGVGIRHALTSDYGSIDHVDGYLEGLVPADAGVDPGDNGFFGYNFADLADSSTIPELVQLTLAHQVAVVPTQSLMVRWTGPGHPAELAQEADMAYMSQGTVLRWMQQVNDFQKEEGYDGTKIERFITIRKQLIKALNDAGVMLLLGSDSPQIFNVPGFSIHHEMQSLLDAGMTPYEILRSGTANPAIYVGQEGEFGTLVEGAAADMILLEGNPLEDLATIKSSAGVMVKGKWISRDEIDIRLAKIARKYE